LLGFGWLLLLPFACEIHAMEPNQEEREMERLITEFPDQQREAMEYDPILHFVARQRALDLGRRNYVGHIDPDGYGPNQAVLAAGYGLPEWWGPQTTIASNNVESLGFGYGGNVKSIFNAWLDSPSHRKHMLAESNFFKNQTRFGVGYARVPNSLHTDYFVLITAPPNASPYHQLEPYSEWLFEHYSVAEIQRATDFTDEDGDGLGRMAEFALQGDPRTKDPSPLSSLRLQGSGPWEWPVPVRERLGSIEVQGESSKALKQWQPQFMRREKDHFVLERFGPDRFFRLVVRRKPPEKEGA
jgi:hypothetical protein